MHNRSLIHRSLIVATVMPAFAAVPFSQAMASQSQRLDAEIGKQPDRT